MSECHHLGLKVYYPLGVIIYILFLFGIKSLLWRFLNQIGHPLNYLTSHHLSHNWNFFENTNHYIFLDFGGLVGHHFKYLEIGPPSSYSEIDFISNISLIEIWYIHFIFPGFYMSTSCPISWDWYFLFLVYRIGSPPYS